MTCPDFHSTANAEYDSTPCRCCHGMASDGYPQHVVGDVEGFVLAYTNVST